MIHPQIQMHAGIGGDILKAGTEGFIMILNKGSSLKQF